MAAYDRSKRALDIGVAAFALVVSAPIQALVAGAVAVALGRPVLFHQQRVGKGEQVFDIVKFRSMRDPDPERGLVTDEQRLTPFGQTLRSTSLDELPSLWNVLRGDMSLVGPRPLLVSYLALYTPRQARRHEVRPGLTGLAQVSGRNALTWEARLSLDVAYVDQRSLGLDLRIMARTLRQVIRREGITDGSCSMAPFTGSSSDSGHVLQEVHEEQEAS